MSSLLEAIYGDSDDVERQVESRLLSAGVLNDVGLLPGVAGRIAVAATTFLKVPIGNVAFFTYRKHRALEKAMRKTRADSSRQVVQLGEHEIELDRRIEIDGELSGVRSTLLELDLIGTIRVDVLTVTVEAGEIVDAQSGKAEAALKLKAGKATIAEHSFRPVDLGKLVFGEDSASLRLMPPPVVEAV